jgi:predicted nucleotidyltransferase component of viral defense system
MHEAIAAMLSKYECRERSDYINALREILQEIALLGLWRGKFFEKAALYGGTALRVLYGLDRYSEDMDFSLLEPFDDFDISGYAAFLQKETEGFGFDVRFEEIQKTQPSPIQSVFLKANTRKQLIVIEAADAIVHAIPKGQTLKIKLEVDTDPPPGFETQARYLLQPIPFAVRCFALPDLFAGKIHAILCRRWKKRMKGRDWYDLVWYAANHPELHLRHLEQRLRQTKDWDGDAPLTSQRCLELLMATIRELNVAEARRDVEPFVKYPQNLSIWSPGFFSDVAQRLKFI